MFGIKTIRVHAGRPRQALRLLSIVATLLAASSAAAEIARAPGYFTFYLDNDMFGGSDKNYTNGVRFSWISEGEKLQEFVPARGQLEKLAGVGGDYRLVRAVSGFDKDSVENGTLELNYGLSLTQLMYTPTDPLSTTQPPGQRRYAGWLGLGFSVHARDPHALNSAELIFGTTGPRSLAEQSQDFVHELRDIQRFEGWDDQIPNEFTLDLSFVQKRRLRIHDAPSTGFSVDGFSEWGVRLGSMRTQAYAGGFFRAGLNLPADFSDPRLSSTAYSHQFFGGESVQEKPWSVYALFGADLTGVAFDATLDGPMFDDFDTGNHREPWYADAFVGFGLRWRTVEFSYVHTWRSKTFREERRHSDFGSVALRLQL